MNNYIGTYMCYVVLFIIIFGYRGLLKRSDDWLDFSSMIYKRDENISREILQRELIKSLTEMLYFIYLNLIITTILLWFVKDEWVFAFSVYIASLTIIIPSIVFRQRLRKYR